LGRGTFAGGCSGGFSIANMLPENEGACQNIFTLAAPCGAFVKKSIGNGKNYVLEDAPPRRKRFTTSQPSFR
jgi:hypothetical protein